MALLDELKARLAEIDSDLAAARDSEAWNALSRLHSARNGVLRLVQVESARAPKPEPEPHISAEDAAIAIAAGILELPDPALILIEAAVAERRRNGLRLVSDDREVLALVRPAP